MYLFIYFWLCWVFISVWGHSLVVASGGHSSSRRAGLSLSRPLLLRSTGSRCASSVVVAHGPSCSAACGILPEQGSNPCPLHWQADSQPLRHEGSPPSFLRLNNIPLYHVPILFNHSSVDGHVGCFHLLAIVSSAAVNMNVRLPVRCTSFKREKYEEMHPEAALWTPSGSSGANARETQLLWTEHPLFVPLWPEHASLGSLVPSTQNALTLGRF